MTCSGPIAQARIGNAKLTFAESSGTFRTLYLKYHLISFYHVRADGTEILISKEGNK